MNYDILTMFYSLYFDCVLPNVDITLAEGNLLLAAANLGCQICAAA